MPMYGLPAGMLAYMGAGAGGGGFQGSMGGALQAFGQAETARAGQGDRQFEQMLQATRLQEQIRAQRMQEAQQAAAQQRALQEQAQQAEARRGYIGSLPPEQQALAQFAPDVLAKQQAEAAFAGQMTEDQRVDNALAARKFAFEQDRFAQEQAAGDPTSLMQNLSAAGLQPGTPEYQAAVLDTITQRRQGEAAADKAKSAVTVQQAKEGAKAETAFKSFQGALQRHRENLQKYGSAMKGEGRTRLNSSATALRAAIKDAQNLGAYDAGVADLLAEMVSDPTSLTSNLSGGLVGLVGGQSARDAALTQLDELEAAAIGELQARSAGGAPEAAAPDLSTLSNEELLRMYQEMQ